MTMAKRIRHTVNALLSALIVMLGFGSCDTSKAALQEANAKIESLEAENAMLKAENNSLQSRLQEAVRRIEEPRKVVYGPPPTRFDSRKK